MNLSALILAVALVAAPAAQTPIITDSGTEPLIEAGWIVPVDGELYVDGAAVAPVAASLDTYEKGTPGYQRVEKFGDAWNVMIDGCDTRNRILQRDFVTFETRDDGCTVVTGVFDDPYSGVTLDFQHSNYPTKGAGNSGAIQIDHIVPLKAGWDGGAHGWTQELREQFANDPMNLWASDGPLNGSKGEKLMGAWQPPNTAFYCEYAAKMVWVLDTYDLAVLPSDQTYLVDTLNGCALPAATGEIAAPSAEPTPAETPVTSESAPAQQSSPLLSPLPIGIAVAFVAALIWVIVVLVRRRS